MKIGILTFHRPVNYGAFLQAYALSSKIQKDFPNCKIEVIDFIAPKEKIKIYKEVLRTLKHSGIKDAVLEINKIKIFHKSLSNLALSDKYFCTNRLNRLFNYINSTYDLLVIGSDAVFNWNQNGYPSAFIPDFSFKIPVVSYAASVHGLEFYEVSKDRIIQCGQTFSKMAEV